MYKIFLDEELFCSSVLEKTAIINPVVSLEANKAGSFSFTVAPNHPRYNDIVTRKSLVHVFQGNVLLFEGVIVEQNIDFYNQKTVICEGSLSFLNDSIQRQAKYQNESALSLLTKYINNHNAEVDGYKKFEVGTVTVHDPNDSIYCFTNMESTMQCIQDDLIENLGGYFVVRREEFYLITDEGDYINVTDGNETAKLVVGATARFLDYLAESPRTNSQIIRIGKNLIDLTKNISASDVATSVIPLGAKLDESTIPELDERLTIKSVNDGKDFIDSPEAIENFGRITKVVTWDNVNTPSILKSKAEEWLANNQFEKMVIDASAFDLSLSQEQFMEFQLLDSVRVVSAPHGLDRYFTITKIQYNLNNPESNRITLGKEERLSLSAKTVSMNHDLERQLPSEAPWLERAKENVRSIIEAGGKGYVYFDYDENGVIRAIMIMDTNNPDTALKRWIWNENGFGYASRTSITGQWSYKTAMTMDGSIVCDFLNGGVIRGQEIEGGSIKGAMIETDNSTDPYKVVINNGSLFIYGRDGSQSKQIFRTAAYGTGSTVLTPTFILGDSKRLYLLNQEGTATDANIVYEYNGSSTTKNKLNGSTSINGDVAISGEVTASNLGQYDSVRPGNVSATSGVWTTIASITLPKGKWMVNGKAWVYAGSKVTYLSLSNASGSSGDAVDSAGGVASNVGMSVSWTKVVLGSASQTVYLVGQQNSGSSQNFYSIALEAIRIS